MSKKPHPPTASRPGSWPSVPPPERWDDWVELDAKAWPERKDPALPLRADDLLQLRVGLRPARLRRQGDGRDPEVRGQPGASRQPRAHLRQGPGDDQPGARPERILKPLKRSARAARASSPVSWDEALEDIGGRIRKAIDEDRHDEVMYHVGRPGEDHFIPRMLQAWGVDGHNSHTNVCSAGARTRLRAVVSADRPSPDYSQTKFILLISAHLETGHYFNPHAQRIIEAADGGARMAVVDTRLSQHRVARPPLDLALAGQRGGAAARRRARAPLDAAASTASSSSAGRTGKSTWLALRPGGAGDLRALPRAPHRALREYTPEFVAEECRIPRDGRPSLADEIARAGSRSRATCGATRRAGNLGGWQSRPGAAAAARADRQLWSRPAA